MVHCSLRYNLHCFTCAYWSIDRSMFSKLQSTLSCDTTEGDQNEWGGQHRLTFSLQGSGFKHKKTNIYCVKLKVRTAFPHRMRRIYNNTYTSTMYGIVFCSWNIRSRPKPGREKVASMQEEEEGTSHFLQAPFHMSTALCQGGSALGHYSLRNWGGGSGIMRSAFSVAAPLLWNSLPWDAHLALSFMRFRCLVKIELFRQAVN